MNKNCGLAERGERGWWLGQRQKRTAQMWWLRNDPKTPSGTTGCVRFKRKGPQLEVSVEYEGSWVMIILIKYPCVMLLRKLKLF